MSDELGLLLISKFKKVFRMHWYTTNTYLISCIQNFLYNFVNKYLLLGYPLYIQYEPRAVKCTVSDLQLCVMVLVMLIILVTFNTSEIYFKRNDDWSQTNQLYPTCNLPGNKKGSIKTQHPFLLVFTVYLILILNNDIFKVYIILDFIFWN